MIDKARIADPTTHYGSPRLATRHFMTQRLTGMANIAFTLFFVWFVVRLAGAERAEMVEVVRNPIVAILLVLMIVNVAVHMRIGMNEVIDDYAEKPATHRLLGGANTAFAFIIAAATILAVAKIVFWG